MADIQQTADSINWEVDKKKIPETLNVLTILTFIGCGLGFLSSLWSFFSAQKSYDAMLQAQGNLENAPDFAKKLAGPEMLEMLRKTLENRIPILLLGVVGYALCLYGAIQMRARKKQGFGIYVIGELLPVAGALIFIGFGILTGFTLAFAFLIPALFIILYATQLKHLS
jgi:hypothetical protein